MGRKKPRSDLHKILHWGRYPGRNHRCKFGGRSVKPFFRGEGSNLSFSIGFRSRPYNTLALPCECVMVFGSVGRREGDIERRLRNWSGLVMGVGGVSQGWPCLEMSWPQYP